MGGFGDRQLFDLHVKNGGYAVTVLTEVTARTMHLAFSARDVTFVIWTTLYNPFFQEAGRDAMLSKVGVLLDGAL